MEDVKDMLHEVEKWAKAYEILETFKNSSCDECNCDECGFLQFCDKACNLVNK
ncbi:hypothetical protein [Clostridium sulfidigenes]|uniref:hypothetical protein n=1 Tax=Clostridium sulfidigenes TaxID=318464 RepID=UPI000AFEBA0D|nr:hypothetical protein [Clostridium sulfidigenes]